MADEVVDEEDSITRQESFRIREEDVCALSLITQLLE
jgi:hypothetical protein